MVHAPTRASDQIGTADIERFKAEKLNEAKLAPKTVNNMLSCLGGSRRNKLRVSQLPVTACRPRESPKNAENESSVN
jgi:hypothetical protein